MTLITLGTPNLGYPRAFSDDGVFCSYLIDPMEGNWRNLQPNGWPWLSPYLRPATQTWQAGSFPGTAGFWLAAGGRSCPQPIRVGDSTTGCQDSRALSDGVVCFDSAGYNISTPSGTGPSYVWSDPGQNYVHSNAGLGVATSEVLCGNSPNSNLLSNPPTNDSLFQTLITTISGR